MTKTIPTTVGILIVVLVAGVAGASVLFFNQDTEEEVALEEETFIEEDEITTDENTTGLGKSVVKIEENVEENKLSEGGFIEVGFNSGGSIIAIYLYEDSSFLSIDMLAVDGSPCYTGSISSQDYDDILEFIKDEDVLSLEITQKDDSECESDLWIKIVDFNNKSNFLVIYCGGGDSESTKQITDIWSELFNKISDAIDEYKKECELGIVLRTSSLSEKCQSISYESAEDLERILQKSLIYKGAYIYGEGISWTLNSHSDKTNWIINHSTGFATIKGTNHTNFNIEPVFYLKYGLKINGKGTVENPFVIE